MNTCVSRLNALFAYTITVLAGLTFCCYLTTAFMDHQANVELGIGRALVRKANDLSIGRVTNDLGFVTIDLNTDLEPLFNWNVKQLFLYITAEYTTPNHAVNQVVLWDKIIQRGESAQFNLKSLNTKYYFWDDGTGLRGNKNVTLTLSWNVIPNAGGLVNVQGRGSHTFAFPDEYLSTKA